MISNKKAEAVGRILINARELDTIRGDHFKLQKLLGEKIYFKNGNKWYYDVNKLSRKSIAELKKISAKIISAVNK